MIKDRAARSLVPLAPVATRPLLALALYSRDQELTRDRWRASCGRAAGSAAVILTTHRPIVISTSPRWRTYTSVIAAARSRLVCGGFLPRTTRQNVCETEFLKDANHALGQGAQSTHLRRACRAPRPSAGTRVLSRGGVQRRVQPSAHGCIGSAVGWPSVKRRLVRSARRAAVRSGRGPVVAWVDVGVASGAWGRCVAAGGTGGVARRIVGVGSVAVRLPSIGSGGGKGS